VAAQYPAPRVALRHSLRLLVVPRFELGFAQLATRHVIVGFAALVKGALRTAAGQKQLCRSVASSTTAAHAHRGQVGRAALPPKVPKEIVQFQHRPSGALGDPRVGIGNDAPEGDVRGDFYGDSLAQLSGKRGGHVHDARSKSDSTEMIIDWDTDLVSILNRPQASAKKELEEKKGLLGGGILVGLEVGEK